MVHFFIWKLALDRPWKVDFNLKREKSALKAYGPIKSDECLGFVPLLALGGGDSVRNMEVVKMREYLLLCAQALS